MGITKSKHTINLDWAVIILLIFAAAVHFTPTLNALVLYAIIPVLTIITLIFSRKICLNAYLTIYFLLIGWLSCTIIWAGNTELAIKEVKMVIGTGMMCYIMSYWMQQKQIQKWMYGVYIVIFLSIMYYAYTEILPNIVLGKDRLNDEEMNANMLAYFSFYFMIIAFILGETPENKITRFVFRILAWLSIILSLVIGILTASRQIVIIQIPLYTLLIYICFFKNNTNFFARIGLLALTVVALILVHFHYHAFLTDNLLVDRLSSGGSDNERYNLLQLAYNIGREHPLTGLGAGNFVVNNPYFLFSHNSYAELWANAGLIGFGLYCSMLILFVYRQIRYYRSTRHILFLYFMWFGIFFIVYQMIYVFYTNMWLMGFFMLIASHSENLYQQEKKKGVEG